MDTTSEYVPQAAALRPLLQRAADQASRLSTILHHAPESDALRPPRPRLPCLTPRESAVLDLISEGLSSKEIARTLGISRATARCHAQNILTKLGVYSRRQAAALACPPPPDHAAPRGPVLPGSAPSDCALPAHALPPARLAALTPRETDVLRALAAGIGKREIAAHFVLSPHTVRTHIQRVLAKLGVHSVLGAMAVARSAGLAPLRPRPSPSS